MSLDERIEAATGRHPSAGADAPGLIVAGEQLPTDSAGGGAPADDPAHVAAGAPRFAACGQCHGAGSVVVLDLTAQLRIQTGQVLTIMTPCPACLGAGGMVVAE